MNPLFSFFTKYKDQLIWAVAGIGIVIGVLVAKEALLSVLVALGYVLHGNKRDSDEARAEALRLKAQRTAEANAAVSQAIAQKERSMRHTATEAGRAARAEVESEIDADFK